MDYFALVNAVERGEVPPVVCLVGEEHWLLSDALKRLKSALLGRAKDFNFTDLDAKEKGVDAAVAAARMVPMMADRRVVLLSRFDEVKGDGVQPLVEYVGHPVSSTVLVLVGKTVDARTSLGKALTGGGYVVNCQPLKRPELDRFVSTLAKQRQLALRPGAFDELFEAYGADLAAWSFALDRMNLYLGGAGGEVDEAMVAELATRTRSESIFALTDAVLSGQASKALPLVETLLDAKEAPLAMVGLVARQVRQMLVLREAQDEGRSPKDELRGLGIPPFAADKILGRCKHVTVPQLRAALERLALADQRLKSVPLDDRLVWFGALWDVMDARGAFDVQEKRG